MFATTEHLILRAYVDSDGKHIGDMYNDERVQRTAEIGYVVPWGPAELKKTIEELNDALMHIIIEIKEDRCSFLSSTLRANINMNSSEGPAMMMTAGQGTWLSTNVTIKTGNCQ
jgi:hypothetical protein